MKEKVNFNFWLRTAREISYAFFIGALPVLTCTTAEEVNALVNTLLAAPPLMKYYLWLLFAFAAVSIFTWRSTYRSFELIGKSRELHRFFVNIGGSLLMAFRAALGAMIGFLLAWWYRDLEGMSVDGVVSVIGYAMFTLVVSVMLAWTDDVLRDPQAASRAG